MPSADLMMPGMGEWSPRRVKRAAPLRCRVTGHGTVEGAVDVRLGAGFVIKPIEGGTSGHPGPRAANARCRAGGQLRPQPVALDSITLWVTARPCRMLRPGERRRPSVQRCLPARRVREGTRREGDPLAAQDAKGRSCKSTAAHCPLACWRANSSVTRRARSPGPSDNTRADLSKQMAER